jgi:hypothetical protein
MTKIVAIHSIRSSCASLTHPEVSHVRSRRRYALNHADAWRDFVGMFFLRFYTVLFVLVAATTSSLAQNKDMSWKDVRSAGKGQLSILIYPQPGIIETNGSTFVGLAADILEDFLEFVKDKYACEVTIRSYGEEKNFEKFLSRIKATTNVIGVSNVTITAARLKEFKFTPPFLLNPVVFVTHKDVQTFTSIESFQKKYESFSAEVVKGSTVDNYLQQLKRNFLPNLTIAYSTSGKQVLEKIAGNPHLFTVVDLTEYMHALKNKLPLRSQNINVTTEIERLGFVMGMASDWDVVWKQFLTASYTESPEYRKNVVGSLGEPFFRLINRTE